MLENILLIIKIPLCNLSGYEDIHVCVLTYILTHVYTYVHMHVPSISPRNCVTLTFHKQRRNIKFNFRERVQNMKIYTHTCVYVYTYILYLFVLQVSVFSFSIRTFLLFQPARCYCCNLFLIPVISCDFFEGDIIWSALKAC